MRIGEKLGHFGGCTVVEIDFNSVGTSMIAVRTDDGMFIQVHRLPDGNFSVLMSRTGLKLSPYPAEISGVQITVEGRVGDFGFMPTPSPCPIPELVDTSGWVKYGDGWGPPELIDPRELARSQ